MATRSNIAGVWTVTCADTSETEVWTNGYPLIVDGDVLALPANVPTGGTWSLGSATGLAYNVSAASLKNELKVTGGSGVIPDAATVTGDYLGGFMIEWPTNGAQSLLPAGSATGLTNGLSPNRLGIFIGEVHYGGGTNPSHEIQSITIGTGWSSQHTSNKAFTLQGAGEDNTIIANNVVGTSLLVFNEVANKLNRITGINIESGTSYNSGNIDSGCPLRFVGQNETSGWRVRIDHSRFCRLPPNGIYTSVVFGVADHNFFDQGYTATYSYNKDWGNSGFGDGSWAYPTSYATDKMFYYEDNIFNQYQGLIGDGTRGGRVCFRHNTIDFGTNAPSALLSCHGLENRNRSIRHAEFYNNYIITLRDQNMCRQRGGTFIAFNNIVATSTVGTPHIGMQFDRSGTSSDFGRASGNNPYDDNDLGGTVNSFNGHTYAGTNADPKPFYVGTATGGSANTLTDSTQSFPTAGSGLDGYCISDLNLPLGNSDLGIPQFKGGTITSNTATSVTISNGTFGGSTAFALGHKYAIWRVDHALDMQGRAGTSASSLITTSPPDPDVCGTAQVTEPWFEWNNKMLAGTDIDFQVASNGFARVGEHVKSDTIATIANGCPVNYPWSALSGSICGAQRTGATNASVTGTGGLTYPHPLIGSVTAPVITSALTAGSTIGNAFSYFITADNSPTSFTASPLPAGFTINTTTGEIACSAGNNIGQPGVYNINISANNSGGADAEVLILTLSGLGGDRRGKGRAKRIGSMGRRF